MNRSKFIKTFSALMVSAVVGGSFFIAPTHLETNNESTITNAATNNITLTLESDFVTFVGGAKTFNVAAGGKLTLDNFQQKATEDGRSLIGVAIKNADGTLSNALTFAEFVAPNTNSTIVPVFGAKAGSNALWVYNGGDSKVNFDLVPGSIAKNNTQESHGKKVFMHNNIALVGTNTVETSYISENSAIRYDLFAQGKIDADTTYELNYVFKNSGTDEIHLDAYNISASGEYKAGQNYFAYENRFRMDVDLLPGESKEFTANYTLNHNGNAIAYLVADQNMPNGMNLSFSVGLKKVSGAAASKNSTEVFDGTVKYELPEGISLAETVKKSGKTNELVTFPTEKEIISNGAKVVGWYNKDTNQPLDARTRYAKSVLTLAPLIAEHETMINAHMANDPQSGTDSNSKITEDYKYSPVSGNAILKKVHLSKVFDANMEGTRIQTALMNKDESFRFKTHPKYNTNYFFSGKTYLFEYRLVNNKNVPAKLELIQVRGGDRVDRDGAVQTGIITIPANDEVTIKYNFTYGGSANKNALTFFIFREGATFDVTSYMRVKEVTTAVANEKVKTDFGMKYKFAKSSNLDIQFTTIEDVSVYADFALNKAVKNVQESGVLFRANKKSIDSAFKTLPSDISASKKLDTKDTHTLRILFKGNEPVLDVPFQFAPYYKVDGIYYTGQTVVTTLRAEAEAKLLDSSLLEMQKAAINEILKN